MATPSLKHLVRPAFPDFDPDADEDVVRLKDALHRVGYDATGNDIVWAWEMHSEDRAAGWLVVSTPQEADAAVKHLLRYLTVETEPT